MEALTARVQQLRSAVSRTPRLEATASGSSRDAERLRELEGRLQEARSSLSEQHPQVQALTRQVASLRGRVRSGGGSSTRMGVSNLHEELQTNLAEAETELEGARHRHGSLAQLAQQAQTRTNRFSTMEGRAASLLAQVNVKQALVNDLTEQKARAEDGLREIQTGFRRLATAQPPEDAMASKQRYLVAAAIPALLVSLVMGWLLFRELRGLRVQTPAEVAWWGNGPVIGATVWPRDPRGLIDLDRGHGRPSARGARHDARGGRHRHRAAPGGRDSRGSSTTTGARPP